VNTDERQSTKSCAEETSRKFQRVIFWIQVTGHLVRLTPSSVGDNLTCLVFEFARHSFLDSLGTFIDYVTRRFNASSAELSLLVGLHLRWDTA